LAGLSSSLLSVAFLFPVSSGLLENFSTLM
jgi:hypothetical protein